MTNYETYESPFCTRYASEEMQFTFSAQKKFSTFRRLWVALARAEMKLGLEQVTQEKVDELEAHIDDIDFAYAAEEEKKLRHDVMAHVHTYGKCCPKAEGIIHLGATSCYVGDNTDVIVMRDAMKIVHRKLVNVLSNFASFADKSLLIYKTEEGGNTFTRVKSFSEECKINEIVRLVGGSSGDEAAVALSKTLLKEAEEYKASLNV